MFGRRRGAKRFSLLLLEEEEDYVQDWVAHCRYVTRFVCKAVANASALSKARSHQTTGCMSYLPNLWQFGRAVFDMRAVVGLNALDSLAVNVPWLASGVAICDVSCMTVLDGYVACP